MSSVSRARMVVSGMMALTGAAFFFEFLADDMRSLPDGASADVPSGLVLRYILAMALGGALSGAALAAFFGHPGVGGWIKAAIGAVLASLLTGLIGSAVGLLPDMLADGFGTGDLIPIGFGLVLIPLSFAGRPYLFAVWLALAIIAHLWAGRARNVGRSDQAP